MLNPIEKNFIWVMLRALFSRILHKESWPVCLKWQMFTVKIEPWGNINLHYSMPICSITVLNEKKKGRESYLQSGRSCCKWTCSPEDKKSKQANKNPKSSSDVSLPGQKWAPLLPQSFVSMKYFWCKSGGTRMGFFFSYFCQKGNFQRFL